MPPFVRVYHAGNTITTREHRRDELETYGPMKVQLPTGELDENEEMIFVEVEFGENRRDIRPGLGAAAYTAENVMAEHAGEDWFVIDEADVFDADGEIPWEALSVANPTAPPDQRVHAIDPGVRDFRRQHLKDVTPGAGGRRDVLAAKAASGTLTTEERADLVALSLGIS